MKVSPEERVALLKQALPLAARAEDKRLILAGLAANPHPEALALAEQISADASVRAEAEIASAAQVVAKTMVSVFKFRVLSKRVRPSGRNPAGTLRQAEPHLNWPP